MKYGLICGMEVHAELKTASKMFCGCKNDPFHAEKPNIYTCPVCLGMPGALPVPNKKAIEWAIKLGLALGCEINLFSKFDRKHYFYPDLPKGYQISQADLPFCINGKVETTFGPVRIRRIHLEEDTGKLLHQTIAGEKVTLVDFNRSSVPLIEIVSEADIRSPEQAMEYAQKLRQIIRYLDIGDCDMEKGGMRVEANLSLLLLEKFPEGIPVPIDESNFLPYKVELKNINSFKFMAAAVNYEMNRQAEILDSGETPAQETRGWNTAKQESFPQRSKENAEDYRYFPDPDIPPFRFTQAQIEELRNELPEMPEIVAQRWADEYGIEAKYIEPALESQNLVQWGEEIVTAAKASQQQPNKVFSALFNKKIPAKIGDPAQSLVDQYIALTSHEQLGDNELRTAVEEVMAQNEDAVTRYKAGQVQLLGFFMGQVMKSLGKKVDPQQIKATIETVLGS